jgi:two-component system, NtrC family, response regulator GlrR
MRGARAIARSRLHYGPPSIRPRRGDGARAVALTNVRRGPLPIHALSAKESNMNASNPRPSSSPWQTGAVTTTAREVQVQRFRVEVVSGPDAGRVATAEGDELCLGTAPTNQLVLTDSSASPHHLVVAATPDGFQVRDLGSRGGTQLGGYRVEVAYIDSGALIQAGETTVRFDALDESLPLPLSERDRFGEVLGQSAAMRRLFDVLEKAAPGDAAILLHGEPGTGKAALAEAIHRASGRATGPFALVDCAAVAPSLIESELFGHERGAFPGADEPRIGAFGVADGGTILLDEVGELSADMQGKLLRVLQTRQLRRIGSVAPVPIDVRVVAATSRDLRQEVNAGSFRSDLFLLLGAARASVPPLRQRRDDIPRLIAHFYRQAAGQEGVEVPADLVASLSRQTWPGNVRELADAVKRAALERQIASEESESAIRSATWPELDFTISFRESKEGALAVWTRVYVRELVDRYGGNLSRAARAVSIDRNHLRDLLHKYAMNTDQP